MYIINTISGPAIPKHRVPHPVLYPYFYQSALSISAFSTVSGFSSCQLNLCRNGWMVHACMLSCSVMSDSLRPIGLQPTRLLCLWDFPGKSTVVGCHFLFQGIFPIQGSNPCLLCLLNCRQILYPLSHQGTISSTAQLKMSQSCKGLHKELKRHIILITKQNKLCIYVSFQKAKHIT